MDLIEKGERALNISISFREEVAKDAQGSFQIAQMLCHEACLSADLLEASETQRSLDISFEAVRVQVLDGLSRAFLEDARRFAKGPKLRREGRAPYLHILNWLAQSNEWSLQLDQARAKHPHQKASVGQVVDKDYLRKFLQQDAEFSNILHFDPATRILSVEDPRFVYFIRNISWSKFARDVGYLNVDFKSLYDFALSFAGADRHIAEAIADKLSEEEIAVFYDKNEQHRILAENIEDYLGPIYRSEAQYIVALLGPQFPRRIWTKFESEQFKARFGEGSVIPIWFSDAPPGMFDESTRVGGLHYDREKDMESQVDYIVSNLILKLRESHLERPDQAAKSSENHNSSTSEQGNQRLF